MRIALAVSLLILTGCAGARVAGDKGPQSFGDAVASPLYDINVMRTRIPPVLLEAMDRPYMLPNPRTCEAVAAQVRPLDEALGPDLDAPPSLENPSAIERGKDAAGQATLGAVGDAASGIIPLRGWVRRLSGAQRHDRYVQAAIVAGAVRRSYLKGMGMQMGCLPPAAPHPIAQRGEPLTTGAPPPPRAPIYPTR
jgi:hypothetical protein